MSSTQLTCKYKQQVEAVIPFNAVGHSKAGDIVGTAQVDSAMITAKVYIKENDQFILHTGNGSRFENIL